MIKNILIIDDEQDVIDLLETNLRKMPGFTISTALDGAVGLSKAQDELPALVLLDLMLPKLPGLEICKILKNDPRTRHIPIIMLSAKAEEIDRVVGLEVGADDYVTKPFSPREVMLRINAIIGRAQPTAADELLVTVGAITLDPARHEVAVSGKVIRLTALEYKLLQGLVRRPGKVQSRDRLLREVWGYDTAMDTRTVDTHMLRLRRKLGKAAKSIITVRGFGYRLSE